MSPVAERGSPQLVLGAVAYDPKVVTIWDGFRAWFRSHGLPLDHVLFSNYERQVEALLAGQVDVAWNSPLAWVRARRAAAAGGQQVAALAMRDSDCDLTSLVVVRADSDIEDVVDLAGRTVAVGAVDSPQATLLPLALLGAKGLVAGRDFEVCRHDIAVGMHGDHVGGEREAARALLAGAVDAACMIDGNHLLFAREGTLPGEATRVLARTARYDHCNLTATAAAPPQLVREFCELLLGMSYDDAELRPLFELEGLKEWRLGRTTGYGQLESAATRLRFYDEEGHVIADGYRP